jgi:hypothetical protein
MNKTVKIFILLILILFAQTELTKKGGGVGIFISNNLNYKLRTDLNIHEDGRVESLFIEIISTTGKNIIVGTIYRPPSGNFEMYET